VSPRRQLSYLEALRSAFLAHPSPAVRWRARITWDAKGQWRFECRHSAVAAREALIMEDSCFRQFLGKTALA
jgi:hypothetical protein